MAFLAEMYERGRGAPADFARARQWYRRAAERGQAWAATKLALMHRDGRGAPRDLAAARAWLAEAVSAGDRDAARLLEELKEPAAS
jgi:TPR repeat protein